MENGSLGPEWRDKVNYLNPKGDTVSNGALYEALCEEGLSNVPQNKETYIQDLMKRGLNEEEAQELYHSELLMGTRFRERGMEYNTLTAPTMMISYGTRGGIT